MPTTPFKLPDGVVYSGGNFFEGQYDPQRDTNILKLISPQDAAARFGTRTPIEQVKQLATPLDIAGNVGTGKGGLRLNLRPGTATNYQDAQSALIENQEIGKLLGLTPEQLSGLSATGAAPLSDELARANADYTAFRAQNPLQTSQTTQTQQNPNLGQPGASQGQFQTTGTQAGDIAAGLIKNGVYSPFQQAFEQTKQAGTQVPQTEGEARTLVNQAAQQAAQTTQVQGPDFATTFVQTDPMLTQLTQAYQAYINPQNQRQSLAQTYQNLVKQSGIEALDLELINIKNVIEGTEQDIRNEATKAAGFVSESDVMALTNARNKQLIKNYNTLLETRNAKEKYLNTLIGLEAQDREAADRRFDQAFNMSLQIADLQQKMQRNAVESLDRTRSAIGWGGILQATQNDPYTRNLIEKTYGLPAGGLELAARNEAQTVKEKKYQPGIIGEYQFYTEQESAAGRKPLSFQEYQNIDANRKKPVTTINVGGLSNQQFQRLNTIADNARQDTNIKDFSAIRAAYETARGATQSKNSAGDIILMRMLAKITDPTTGVREEEYRTFQSAIGTLPRYGVNLTTALIGKGQLTDDGRKVLLNEIQKIYDQRKAAYDNSVKFFETQAKKAGGTAEDVLPVYTAPEITNKQTADEYVNNYVNSIGGYLKGLNIKK